jgi:hypothetical protein
LSSISPVLYGKSACRLGVDFERVFLIQQIEIEPLTAHLVSVLQTTTG